MKLKQIHLTDFRSYPKRSFEFSPEITLIVGPNAAGKTNILEAIYLLATGGSWRTENTKEMIRFGAEVSHIIGHIQENGGDVGLHLILTGGTVGGKRSATVLYKVDDVPRRRVDFVSRLKIVLFEPESLEIVIGNPSFRRRFLDEALSQADQEYVRSFHAYTKALRIRNKLLDAVRDGRSRRDGLEYWERTMVKHGELLQNKRRGLVEWINFKTDSLRIDYQLNPISPDRLEKYREREIEAGFTFVGPQRDELEIQKRLAGQQVNRLKTQPDNLSAFQPLSSFGSRGEQRMAVLQLKLLEAKWIEEKTGVSPVILLDDIFSELDEKHEKMVGGLIEGKQAIITATEIHKGHYSEAEIVELK